MTNIDYALIVGLVLLLLVVAIRIRNGRIRKTEGSAAPDIRAPRTVATLAPESEAPDHEPSAPATSNAKPAIQEEKKEKEPQVSRKAKKKAGHEPVASLPAQQEEILDPITLIRTFSAPVEKRVAAIREVGEARLTEAVPSLIEALYEPDQTISLAATESLGMIGDPRAIEPLLEISRRSDAALIKSIGADSPDKSSNADSEKENEEIVDANPYKFKEMVVFKIDQLPVEYFQPDGTPLPRKELVVRGLKDNSQQMRQMAAKAAIGLDSEDVVEPLIEALANPFEVESVRFMAAEALGGMQNDKSIESLLRALKDENVAVRYSAAAALSGRKDEVIVNALIEATRDQDKFVRSSVAYALGSTGEPEALKALFRCAADENDVVRFSAAKAISSFSSDEVFSGLQSLTGLSDRDKDLVEVEILGHLKDKRALAQLRKLLKSEDSEIAYKASTALIAQENPDLLEELIEASKRLDDELFAMARQNLQTVVSGSSANQATEAAESGAGFTVKSLSDLKNLPANLEKLRKSLLDPSPNIRGSAANTLGDFQSPEATQLLAAAAKDENEYVRASAVNSLGRIASAEAFEHVLHYEKDPSEEVRYAVVKALSACADETGKECLARIARSDRSKNVKRAARLTLEKLNS
ncbi:MAG: HEAT repeat domain-containing protein [Candidatus Riflebacteria bacterium]|nr:HEAT repeat domain-containing protein [Candidatus Riflebacteria bacterium]